MLLSTDHFTYKAGHFCGEASDIPELRSSSPAGRITLRNPKTGGLCAFLLMETERDGDGDLVCWKYGEAEEVSKGYAVTLSMTIYND